MHDYLYVGVLPSGSLWASGIVYNYVNLAIIHLRQYSMLI